MTQLQGRPQRATPLVLWAACFGMLLACRSPADPSGIDVLGDAGTPDKQKPEVDPSSDKPVGPIAERPPLGGMANRDGDPTPRDLLGGAGNGGASGGAGTPGKVPVDSVARRNARTAL